MGPRSVQFSNSLGCALHEARQIAIQFSSGSLGDRESAHWFLRFVGQFNESIVPKLYGRLLLRIVLELAFARSTTMWLHQNFPESSYIRIH